jgi:TPR repeat protein
MKLKRVNIKQWWKIICWLAFCVCIHQSCLASSAENTDILKNNFSRNAPLPVWALPLAQIPETNRTDPVVVRLNEYQIQLGTETAILMNRAIQVNEKNALAKIGQYSIVYYPLFQKLKLHKIAIIRAGHVIDKMDSVNIRQLQRETNMEMGMYGGATTVELLLDDVRIGDTLWLTYSVIGENPVFDKKWHSEFRWDSNEPIEKRRITLTYPKDRKIYWDQIGDFKKELIPNHIEEINGQHRIQFEENGIDAIEFEQFTPPEYMPIRLLEFSEFSDWQGVAKWAVGLFPKAQENSSLNELANEFNRENTPEKKAAAALHWVQNEVRYFSVSIGENSHRPQSPETVIKKRYGDCKDKSYLLVSILAKLGIKANPILIALHAPKIPAKVLPSPEWFDHVIVRIDLNGQYYFVDPTLTGQVSPLTSLPIAMPGASGLLVDGATTDVMTIPERADVGPNYEHTENIVIEKFDGDAILLMHDVYSGFYSDFARNHFLNLSSIELKKEILSFYEKQYPGATIIDSPELRDDRNQNQYHVQARLKLPVPIKHEKELYSINFDSQILKGSMKIPDKLVRNSPFSILSGKHTSRYRLVINWPDVVRANFPQLSKRIDNAFFSIKDDYLISGHQTSYLLDFQVKNDIVPAEEMSTLYEQTKLLDKYVNNSMNIPEKFVLSTDSLDLSFRSLDASKVIGYLYQQKQKAVKQLEDKTEFNDEMCNFLVNSINYSDVFYVDPNFRIFITGAKNVGDLKNDKEKKCFPYLLYLQGLFSESVSIASADNALTADNAMTKYLAWAHFYAHDNDSALTFMDRYITANTANNHWFNPLDIASQIALYRRIGKPLNEKTLNFVDAFSQGNWPQPIFAMQLGSLQPEALLNLTQTMPADMRDILQAQAWFFVGQKYLADKNQIEAGKAFKKVLARGMRSADFYMQAKYELNQLENADTDDIAGLTAYRNKDFAAANSIWEKNANAGSVISQRRLAISFISGEGVSIDYLKALALLQRSAGQGDEIAQYQLAYMYEHGQGVEEDIEKAIYWYKKSVDQDYYLAQYNLGKLYFARGEIDKNTEDAIKLFDLAADQNYSEAQGQLSYYYIEVKKNYSAALTWAWLGTVNGNSTAMNNLGTLYEHGFGVQKDIGKAIEFYRLSADKGNAQAQNNLALKYRFGPGVKMDNGEAMKLFRLSADQNNPYAQFHLGEIFEQGKYPDGELKSTDLVESEKWYRLSANNGFKDAQYRLAQFYDNGIGVKKDMALAIEWYKKAAEQNHIDASNDLGVIYAEGIGVAPDKDQAIKWYLKAAKLGNLTAQNNVGSFYLTDEERPGHLAEAEKWFRSAAESGSVDAQNNLAVLLTRVDSDTKNEIEAYKWWQLVKKSSRPGSANFKSSSAGLSALSAKLTMDQIAEANNTFDEWLTAKGITITALPKQGFTKITRSDGSSQYIPMK